MKPLVTLAITTLNRTTYLSETLASALAQDYANLDILVSDNGSHDDTLRVAKSLINSDPRVRFRHNDITVPLHEHFTQCLQEARGQYFILLHDDDRINSNFVSELVGVAMCYPDVNVVAPANIIIDAQGAHLQELAKPDGAVFDGPTFICDWLYGRGPQLLADVTTVLFRTEIMRCFGGYQCLGGGRNVDNLIFLQCAVTSRVGFAHRAIFYWRRYPLSYGNKATPQQIAESGRQFVRHLRRDPRTVHALAAIPSSRRKRILCGVKELTALEVFSQIKPEKQAFRWESMCKLLRSRRDFIFLYLLLREWLRHSSPRVYYCLRDLVRRFRVLPRDGAGRGIPVQTRNLETGARNPSPEVGASN
jgi:glycosyltransferase involved in cell wall biosynthesis